MKTTLHLLAALLLLAGITSRAEEGAAPQKGKGDCFATADTDGDGKISKDEFKAVCPAEKADKIFAKKDANQDGFLDKAEMKKHHKGPKGKGGCDPEGPAKGGEGKGPCGKGGEGSL